MPAQPQQFWRRRLWIQGFAVAAVGVPALVLAGNASATVGALLPTAALDLSYSFTRMLLAYLLSTGFALSYGYFAATTRTGERLLIPILDILQSVPILGFFPVAVTFFVAISPHTLIGPNLASIFLIFTSMSWNMAFGVYESLKSLPNELKEATDSFGARGFQRVRDVLFPATVNRFVYNSVLSWTAGWYFLVAAEFISTRSSTTALPGIGTFLLTNAAPPGNFAALAVGLALLVALIAVLDLLLWRPLARYAEKFRYDTTPSGEAELVAGRSRVAPFRRAAGLVVRGVRTGVTRLGTPFVGLTSLATRGRPAGASTQAVARYGVLGTILVLVWLLLITLTVGVVHVFTAPISAPVRSQMLELPLALFESLGRVTAAYAICVGVSLPLAIFLYRRPGFSRIGLPVIEVVASVPATALFPLFIFALLAVIHSQLTAILMLTTGMLWYLFFNVLSGLRGIPPDLAEAARSYGLTRREYYRQLVLPAILPAFITGSITAFGGGWNTLIIAENLRYGTSQSLQVLGIGDLLDVGNIESGGYPLMVAALFALILAVITLNELIWKPLYRRAVERYRID
ncbi:MAG: ABC transporter permease subunit [Thermoplasmata archaeon]|nr:ABC transporter permease subunit [Thermoplasmata archaeon]